MKTVLLTRSEADNKVLKSALEPLGFICHECSLIEYQDISFDYSDLNRYTDIIITSKHAANLLPHLTYGKKIFASVVGEISAGILKEKGYIIRQIADSANDLKNQIPAGLYHQMVYLSANIISTPMPGKIDRRILYNVIYRDSLPTNINARLQKGIDFIPLYSENCAKTLIKLLLENNLLKYLENTVVIGISSKVEQVIKPYVSHRIACKTPSEMIQILKTYAKSN
jgi:uroporphyrinogen-III synthase